MVLSITNKGQVYPKQRPGPHLQLVVMVVWCDFGKQASTWWDLNSQPGVMGKVLLLLSHHLPPPHTRSLIHIMIRECATHAWNSVHDIYSLLIPIIRVLPAQEAIRTFSCPHRQRFVHLGRTTKWLAWSSHEWAKVKNDICCGSIPWQDREVSESVYLHHDALTRITCKILCGDNVSIFL